MAAQQQCVLPQNPSNQISQLSWFFQAIWKTAIKSINIGLQGITSGWNKFFFVFLSCHYGFTNCFEILNLVFSNIISRGVSTCKILTTH